MIGGSGMMFLLPPADDLCQECALDHEPSIPHNPQRLYYQVRFKMLYGRQPTWEDAIAHCDEDTQERWRRALAARGVDVRSTKLTPQEEEAQS